MSIEKIKNPLTKILNRLDSLQENQPLSKLDREYLGNLMIEAYDHLQSAGKEEEEKTEPPRHNVFQFDETVPQATSEKLGRSERVKENERQEPEEKDSKEVSESTKTEEPKSPEPQGEKSDKNESKPAEEEVINEGDVSEELQEIFRIKESTELSERLSQMPINDIWNAMGLNERIFTQNELFGGDQESFRSAVQQLNQMEDFDQAKRFLIKGVAEEYDWAVEGRKNIAKNFVRLIKRKFK